MASPDPKMVYHLASIREQLQEAIAKVEEVQEQREQGIIPAYDEEITVVLVWMATRAIATFEMMLLSMGSQVDAFLPDDWRSTLSHPEEMSNYGKDLAGFLEGAKERMQEIESLYEQAYEASRQEAALGEEGFIGDDELMNILESWKLED